MELLVGAVLALTVCCFATIIGFDRDRAFYPTMVIVVASYYILFAVMGGSSRSLMWELVGMSVFLVLSGIGFKVSLWWAAGALAAHGVFDWFHARLIADPGVPVWWPGFCMAFDVVAAAYLAWLLVRSELLPSAIRAPQRTAGLSHRIGPFIRAELLAAADCDERGDFANSFSHLERAHVLGQASTREHVRVHWQMLRWAMHRRQLSESANQVFRIVGAATMTGIGLVPEGNT
ncbi:MAG: DUF3703 domain-containing protein [Steroidobacteraceae bacterium]